MQHELHGLHQMIQGERRAEVNRNGAAVDGQMRIEWAPFFVGEDGEPVPVAGSRPLFQKINFVILSVVDLHSGVLALAAASELAWASWRAEEAHR